MKTKIRHHHTVRRPAQVAANFDTTLRLVEDAIAAGRVVTSDPKLIAAQDVLWNADSALETKIESMFERGEKRWDAEHPGVYNPALPPGQYGNTYPTGDVAPSLAPGGLADLLINFGDDSEDD